VFSTIFSAKGAIIASLAELDLGQSAILILETDNNLESF
jgi:hypothetical protein